MDAIRFVLIGHVDSGKSTLAGRLLVDSNTIDKREIDRIKTKADNIKMNKWWLAHITDTDKNEQKRGKTMEWNMTQFNYNDQLFYIYDAPGHIERLNEMIDATCHAQIAVLVISIRKGEYKSSLKQSLEHAIVSRAIGINSIIICINKMDSINWNNEEYNRIKNDICKRIRYYRFKHIKILPISAFHGQNIFNKYDNILTEFSLIEALNNINIVPNNNNIIKPINYIINARVIFHQISNIITVGYICKLHALNKVFDAEIIEIQNGNYNFVTENNSKGKAIKVILKIDSNDDINTNIILIH